MSIKKRINSLEQSMDKKRLESMLITSNRDIFYYTGIIIPDFEKALLVFDPKKRSTLITSSLGGDIKSTKGVGVRMIKKKDDLKKLLPKIKGRVGFDEHTMRVSLYKILKSEKLRLISSSRIIKEPRRIKDNFEIKLIKNSIDKTRQVFSSIELENKTEKEVAANIECSFIKMGGKIAFETIVASDEASIHHVPSERKVKPGETTIVDAGIRLNNYCSDMTRTFCKRPKPKTKKLLENIENIQKTLIDNIYSGIKVDELTKLYIKEMKRYRYKVMHGFGHSIGLSVHEDLGKKIENNMVMTIEPGAYSKEFGGCRIEDIVLIRKNKAVVL